MTYEENKKLIEAADLLKEHCNKKFKYLEECYCPFAIGSICRIGNSCPNAWDVPKESRWTPEDVALAKALKAAGATEIYGSTSYGRRSWRIDDGSGGFLPELAFQNMEYMEVVRIDDIIKEAEEI